MVLFSSSTIWDLLGVSDSTEGKYRGDIPVPLLTQTPPELPAQPDERMLLKAQMELSSSGCPCQLQEGGKGDSHLSIPVAAAPPVPLRSHCSDWNADVHRV